MSDAPQGPGWWLASDGKWYPPQVDGPPPPPSPTQASAPQPFIGPPAVQPPGWVPSPALPPPTRSRRKKRVVLALAAVIVIIVVLAAIGASNGGGSATSNTSAVCADLNSLFFNGGPTIPGLNIATGDTTTVLTVYAAITQVQNEETIKGSGAIEAADLKIAAANAATLAAEISSGIQVDGLEGPPDDLHTNLVNIAATLKNAANGDYTYVGTGNESENVFEWSGENCPGIGNTGTTGVGAGTTF